MTGTADRPAAPELPGYRFRSVLGRGGFADVYLYEQERARRDVAVKVLREAVDRTRDRAAITAEAEVMAQLSTHPYIVTIHDADVAPDGRPYLVMEYYSRPNFARRARSGGFDVPDALRVGVQVASAVETAHRAGIVHRDIKPANILTSDYGWPGLTDFGIASRTGAAADDGALSVPWAAPELFRGAVVPDRRADIYALGATLWTLLVGRSPFEAKDGDNSELVLWYRIEQNPVPPTGRPDAPPSLERVLRQAMAKRPEDRFATALEFARELQSIQGELHQAVEPLALPDLGLTGTRPHGPETSPTPGAPAEPDEAAVVTVLRPPRAARPPAARPAPAPRPAGWDDVPVVPGALPHAGTGRPAPPAVTPLPPLPPLPPPPVAAPPVARQPLPGPQPGPGRPVPLEYGQPVATRSALAGPGLAGPGLDLATASTGRGRGRRHRPRTGPGTARPAPGGRRWLVPGLVAGAVAVLGAGGVLALDPFGAGADPSPGADGHPADTDAVGVPSGREILHDPPAPTGTAVRLGPTRVRFSWGVAPGADVAGYLVTRDDGGRGPHPSRQAVSATTFELAGLAGTDRPCLSVTSTSRTGRTSPAGRICAP